MYVCMCVSAGERGRGNREIANGDRRRPGCDQPPLGAGEDIETYLPAIHADIQPLPEQVTEQQRDIHR